MANEISYPFTADSAGGGAQMITQDQWQYLSRMFAKDRVDFQLSPASLSASDLPFYATVVNGTTVSITPGRALVGGFAYQLTASKTVAIASNTGTVGRIDLIVLRANVTTKAVNLAVVQGQPAASPAAPALTRTYGGIWEMPLHQVSVPANSGPLSLISVMPYDAPDMMAAPWNTSETAAFQPVGTRIIDMDNNTSDTQSEYFVGRDGTTITRDLGKSRSYTPSLVNATFDLPVANKKGRWRYIAPGVVHFSMHLINDYEDQGPVRTGSNTLGVTLPTPASGATGHCFTGVLVNPDSQGAMPNMVDISLRVQRSGSAQSVAYMYRPNSTNIAEGLDGLINIPPRSNLTISGVYETSAFGNI